MNAMSRRLATRALLLLAPILGAALLVGAAAAPKTPGPKDRCAACGMLVAPYESWVTQLHFADGSVAFFDGSKCLFRFLLRRAAEGERGEPALAGGFVTGYYDLKPIPFDQAWFVTGSDVTGPMGAELVPLATREEAEEFSADHQGRSIVRASDVTLELLASLR